MTRSRTFGGTEITGNGTAAIGGAQRRRRHGVRRVAVVTLALLATVLVPAMPAEAYGPPALTYRQNIAPGLVQEGYRVTTSGGSVSVQVLRFKTEDRRLDFRPELGHGHVPGREATDETLRRLGDTAVAGVNATFHGFSPGPSGDPNGFMVRDGVYVSNGEKPGRRWRGAFGQLPDGSYQVGTPEFSGRVTLPDGSVVPLSGVNRWPARPRPGTPNETEAVLINPGFGARTYTPNGTVEVVVNSIVATPGTDMVGRVGAVRTGGNSSIWSTGVVLAGTGSRGAKLATLRPDDEVRVELDTTPGWEDVVEAMGAGPLLMRDGQKLPSWWWFDEGFGERHNYQRHPRTVIGFTRDDHVLLITVDGRRSGHSVGMTTADTAHLMEHLDVTDAVMMDGGGSTTMSVDGRITNRPCCDAAGFRPVSASLVVSSNVPTPDIGRIRGSSGYTVAANAARAGWPDGAETVVLANGYWFAEQLAAAPLAASRDAPLLLTGSTGLPDQTARVLGELGTRRVIIAGGDHVVGQRVVNQLKSAGYSVKRLGAPDRISTAARLAWYVNARPDRVFLASAADWRESQGAAVGAGRSRSPILLTAPGKLSEQAARALKQLQPRQVVVVGSTNVVRNQVVRDLQERGYAVTRVAGTDRWTSTAAHAEWAIRETGVFATEPIVASGRGHAIGITAAPLAARLGRPLLITHPDDLDRSPGSRNWFDRRPITGATIMGNPTNVGTWIAHELQALVGG